MSEAAWRNLKFLHRYADELLNIPVSHPVIIHRALEMYNLHLMERLYHANIQFKGNPQKIAETLMTLHETERKQLIKTAGKDVASILEQLEPGNEEEEDFLEQ
jgi:hypothetical protein